MAVGIGVPRKAEGFIPGTNDRLVQYTQADGYLEVTDLPFTGSGLVANRNGNIRPELHGGQMQGPGGTRSDILYDISVGARAEVVDSNGAIIETRVFDGMINGEASWRIE